MASPDIDSLHEAVKQYKGQLSQIEFAINNTSGTEHDSLVLLQSEIKELITLTLETLHSLEKQKAVSATSCDDHLAAEYALFKAELENDNIDEVKNNSGKTIEDDLKSLNGMKCQAPHKHQWGEVCYHNALVCGTTSSEDVSSLDEIQVRVMFVNPTHQEMLPCPYYLDGECRFSDVKCRYSHGEVVCLSSLKEYKDPDFSLMLPGKGILAKNSDNLWYRAIVLSSPEDNKIAVKFESSGKKCEIDLHDTFPLAEEESERSCDDEYDVSDDSEEVEDIIMDQFLVQQSLLKSPPNLPLGGWEKYTKGFGSRLMAQMGYIVGNGLGKNGEGRVEPIEAVVLPAGKSLDHCMELKEQAGGDENLFKVEKRLRRIQRKEEQRQKQLMNKEQQNKDIFDFINTKLGGKRGDINDLQVGCSSSNDTSRVSKKTLQAESSKNLNLVGFQVDQEIKRANQDIARMKESLDRHEQGSASYKRIQSQMQEKQNDLKQLKLSESSINQEHKRRKDHKKLTIF